MDDLSPKTEPAQTHCLDLGAAGSAKLGLTFAENDILAVMDVPAGLKRRDRRFLNRWSHRIFSQLNPDQREMRMVTTSGGKIISIGVEKNGAVAVVTE